jgi:aquaporin Z
MFFSDLKRAAASHWPELLIEAGGLALFMISALAFTVLLEHPASPLRRALPAPLLRRALMGCAMGVTLVTLVYSSFGKRSGAHFNPFFTLTFFRLGKVAPSDALLYALSQFAGAAAGVAVLSLGLSALLSHVQVHYAATRPGAGGAGVAFAAELAISFVQMLLVLVVSNARRWNAWTGVVAACGVATYITLEAPLSGMSMNPARTLGSALGAHDFTALWIYFSAPLAGMLLAAELYLRVRGAKRVLCAKLHHANHERCIFRCDYHAAV